MLRNKRILLIIVLAVAVFLIPSICSAATIDATETTTTSTGKTVKWSYELEGESIVNLKCTNPSEITGTITIPSKIDGHTVVTIGNTENTYTHYDGAFEGCNGLTGITIPNTVTTIGSEAFRECVGLKNITIPNTVTSIGQYAFYGCSGITSIILSENLSKIGSHAFYECTGLKTITLPNTLTTIQTYAFYGCTGLKAIIIPDNVTILGEYSFSKCTGLTNATLSKNLTKIDRGTFSKCTGLTSIVIPESVTTIAGYNGTIYGAFEDCTKLEKVLIPDSVATIEKSAFYNCPKLTIYGNDNQTSKQYAEENKIKFNYIKNWDKGSSGSDIAAPEVKSLYVEYSSVMNYWDKNTNTYRVPTNGQIIICLKFNEAIAGKTAPELTIKFGVGSNIKLSSGVINGETVTYNYTVKSTDVGLISSVSLTGGNITDLAGNKANISCPKIITEYQSGDNKVYANGKSTSPEVDNTQNSETTVKLSSIAITKTPTRNTYSEGESFDKSGMIITAIYSDGSKKEITNYTVSPSGALKSTDTKVYITYTENGVTKAVEQKITVLGKSENNNLNENIITNTNKNQNTNKNNTTNKYKNDTIKDTTIKNDSKLPQTGATVMIVVIISLIVIGVVSKLKYGRYKDI